MNTLLRNFLLILLILILSKATISQHLSWRNFSTEQGLPGNEVYNVIQDRQGLLWFSTNQGICHFNGYEFIRPVDTSVQRGSEAFLMIEDPMGRIWFARPDASVWRIENDTIRAWKFNNLIASYREKFNQLEKLSITMDDIVWLGLAGFGLLFINEDGSHRLINSTSDFIFAEVNNQLIYTTAVNSAGIVGVPWMKVLKWQNDSLISINNLPRMPLLNEQERGIWKLRNGDLIFNYKGTFYYIRDNHELWKLATGILTYKVYETPAGEILISSHKGEKSGLWYFASLDQFRLNNGKNLLPGQFVTNVLSDREGGWWVTTLNAGIFYCNNPKLDIFDITSGLPSNDILRLANDGKETVFAGLRPAEIGVINRLNGRSKRLPIPKLPIGKFDIWTVFYDTVHRKLWISNPLLYFNKNKWETTFL
ncbi:MAG: hypothetical protein IPP42_18540 [Saprospiraceae bacterium]|nr:hypothetical protein [Saprospiraceae bacterium]